MPPDSKVPVTPIGHRAHWARVRTPFDPPEPDNMQGASEPQIEPPQVVSPTVKRACERLEKATSDLVEAMGLVEKLASLAPSDADRAFMDATSTRCAEQVEALKDPE